MVVALALAAACGGDEGAGGDVFSLEGGLGGTYAEAVAEDSPFGHDPEMFAQEESTIQGIEVGLWSEHTGSGAADGFAEYFFLNFKADTAAGTYALADGALSVLYRSDDVLFFGNDTVAGAAGTAELTFVGDVGDAVRGTFEVTLCQSVNASDFPSNCDAGQRAFRGSFDVTREPLGTAGRGKE